MEADMTELIANECAVFLGEGVTFSGSMVAPGLASINGKVNGEVTAIDLQIGPTGHVSGRIEARMIDVHGVLAETIVCHEHILIHSCGKVSGQLDYDHIEIERGGEFKGKLVQHVMTPSESDGVLSIRVQSPKEDN
jgi:cytoskeletal protein CcmA (bactofilin family)